MDWKILYDEEPARLEGPTLHGLWGGVAPMYGTQTIVTKVTDDLGVTRTQSHTFRVSDAGEYDVILGIPWGQKAEPNFEWKTLGWTHPLKLSDISLIQGTRAINQARKQSKWVFMLAATRHMGGGRDNTRGPPMPVQESPGKDIPPLPEEYRDWAHVFDVDKAGKPAEEGARVHPIDLEEGKTPPWGPIYPLAEKELEELRQYLASALEKGWIRVSKSPAGAPILFVPKKGGKLRLCVDYRGLNNVTVKNRTPLPLISEILDRLQGASWFTKLDLKDAYHRVRIRPGDEWKTAFRTRYGHFEYRVMPFGLVNAPATFQSYINDALAGLVDVICVVYLDDILIFTKTREQHTEAVKQVLSRLSAAGLFANPEKCEFYTKSVEFLGFVVSPEGIAMEQERVGAIAKWPVPSSVKDIQVFLGFTGFYRRFIRNYSKVCAALTDRLAKQARGEQVMTTGAREAFFKLRLLFTKAPILRHFNPALPIRVETDASDFAIGAVMCQLEDGQWRPVAFMSRKLRGAELRYGTPEAELLAIREAAMTWRHYLLYSQHQVTFITDHLGHRYLATKPQLNSRQARLLQDLSLFDFVIDYRPGRENSADGLSRRPDHRPTEEETQGANGAFLKDFLGRFRGPLVATVRGEGHRTTKAPENIAPEQIGGTLEEDVLKAQKEALEAGREGLQQRGSGWTSSDRGVRFQGRLVIPDNHSLRMEIMTAFHDEPLGGHLGVSKTLKRIGQTYWWKSMRKDVKEYVSTCAICQRTKPRHHLPYGKLAPLPVPSRPWEHISMDLITKLPTSKGFSGKNYDSILVVIDRFTKYALYLAVRETLTADELAALLVNKVFLKYGVTSSITSDRGSLFTSKFWATVAHLLAIKRKLSTAYHPQTDGQTERQNQNVEHFLRVFTNFDQDDWAKWLPMAEFVYNNSAHSATGVPPAEALMGYVPRGPHDSSPEGFPPHNVPTARDRVQHLRTRHHGIQRLLEDVNKGYARWYDKRRATLDLKVGDQALISTRNIRQKRPSRKLSDKYLGPFTVKRVVNGGRAFELDLGNRYRIHNVFAPAQLEKFKGDTIAPRVVPIEEEDADVYEVDYIAGHKGPKRNRWYLIKWRGYREEENSWEPQRNVAVELRSQYERQRERVTRGAAREQ